MNPAASAHAAALWAGLCLIVLVVLSVLVTRQRRKHNVVIGHGDVPELERAVRAFGNATEYVPTALAGLGILAIAGAPPLLIHPIGFLLFAGRVLHAIGLSRNSGVSWPRTVGVLFTWVAYIAAAASLIFYAIP